MRLMWVTDLSVKLFFDLLTTHWPVTRFFFLLVFKLNQNRQSTRPVETLDANGVWKTIKTHDVPLVIISCLCHKVSSKDLSHCFLIFLFELNLQGNWNTRCPKMKLKLVHSTATAVGLACDNIPVASLTPKTGLWCVEWVKSRSAHCSC